jgi:hypothetical protein
MRLFSLAAAVALSSTLLACTHIKGVVYEDTPGSRTNRPLRTAALSIGRPTGLAVYGTYHVDENGNFDFYIGPTDHDNVFVYDNAANPEITMHRIDPNQLSDHMVLRMRRAGVGNPALPGDININP